MSYVRYPKARRLPINTLWSHRAVIRHTVDDHIITETDARAELAFPCLRFLEDIDVAFFVYGHAPGDQTDVPERVPAQEQHDHLVRTGQRRDPERPEAGTPIQPRQLHRDPDDFGEQDDSPQEPSRSTAGDIRFPGIDATVVPRHIQQMVARMHMSFGHPPRKEFLRFTSRQGASARVLQAVYVLYCPTCERLTKHHRR